MSDCLQSPRMVGACNLPLLQADPSRNVRKSRAKRHQGRAAGVRGHPPAPPGATHAYHVRPLAHSHFPKPVPVARINHVVTLSLQMADNSSHCRAYRERVKQDPAKRSALQAKRREYMRAYRSRLSGTPVVTPVVTGKPPVVTPVITSPAVITDDFFELTLDTEEAQDD